MDLWGTGCVFFEVLSLFPLFPGNDELDQINKIHDIMGTPAKSVFDNFQKHATHMKFNFTPKEATNLRRLAPHVSAEALDLIEKLLTYVEDQRFTAKQALNHPYFKEFRSQEKSFALDPLLITENPEDEQKTLKQYQRSSRKFQAENNKNSETKLLPDKRNTSMDCEDSATHNLPPIKQPGDTLKKKNHYDYKNFKYIMGGVKKPITLQPQLLNGKKIAYSKKPYISPYSKKAIINKK
eukprot:TRINITY_DN1152_c0_g2_i2.p1 TRINITY_DN1152_c0_g2~~TRINITY_DN1152_c0_g2_i2.p1  ORF type:complete len:238 (-),score=76.40 TRINITY_DN1152_c0_g2_i2:117-830(-)